MGQLGLVIYLRLGRQKPYQVVVTAGQVGATSVQPSVSAILMKNSTGLHPHDTENRSGSC